MQIRTNDNSRPIFLTFSNADLYDQGRDVLFSKIVARLRFTQRRPIQLHIILVTARELA